MKRIGKVLLIVFAVIGVGYVVLSVYLTFFLDPSCRVQLVLDTVSPSGKHRAVQTRKVCDPQGIVEHWLGIEKTHPGILESRGQGIQLSSEESRQGDLRDTPKLILEWVSNDHLLARYPKNSGIKLSSLELEGVKITAEEYVP